MNRYTYKVNSVETVRTESARQFARISLISPYSAEDFSQSELCISINDVRPGDLVVLTALKSPRLYFLHHHDRPNQGDALSGPYNYFDLKTPFDKLSWDKQIVKGAPFHVYGEDSIILGGGIFFSDNKPRLYQAVQQCKNFIGWGVGIDPRSDFMRFVSKFSLLGTRERNAEYIDNDKVFYVPCSSCMNNVFSNHGSARTRKDIAVHINGGFNAKQLVKYFSSCDSTKTVDCFASIVKNISEGDCTITNSYHGAYWASLFGKRVVCIKTDVPKWGGLHENVVFSDISDVQSAVKKALRVPDDYLQECRSLNVAFYEKVKALLYC